MRPFHAPPSNYFGRTLVFLFYMLQFKVSPLAFLLFLQDLQRHESSSRSKGWCVCVGGVLEDAAGALSPALPVPAAAAVELQRAEPGCSSVCVAATANSGRAAKTHRGVK